MTPLTDQQLEAIKARADKATPGPWGWFGNTDVHSIYLATKGFGRLTVMSFRRWGLQNAQPMFATDRTWKSDPQSGDDFGTCGRMEMAARLARYEVAPDAPDHTHPDVYRRDLNGIKNPDAEFIAHARQDVPALLAEVDRLKAEVWQLNDQLDTTRVAAADGAETDGAHHKQWFLVGIARSLGYSWRDGDVDEGIAP